MSLRLDKIQLNLSSVSFAMLTKFIFNNIIFTDGFVLEPQKLKK
jgi:hypothetical protein